MAKFEEAIKDVLDAEGGFVNHPDDKGGPTNFGITQAVLAAYRNKIVTVADVKNLTLDEAKEIYKALYWNEIQLDKIDSQLIADVVFDQAVNRGNRTAIKNLQESYNTISRTKLVVDGDIGPKTISAINEIDSIMIAAAFLKDAQLDYATIVANNSSQRVFIKGWINRTHKLLDKILSYIPKSDKVSEDKITDLLNRILNNSPELPKAGVERMLQFLPHAKKTDKIIFVDFNKKDTLKRLYVIDTSTGKSTKYLVAHGKASDPNKDGFATDFSNENGSNKSSLGAMLTGNLYGKAIGGWSKFLHALKLHGLEVGVNDNVYDRAMVMHDAPYVKNAGDSLGCFALTPEDAELLIPALAGGYLLYGHYQA